MSHIKKNKINTPFIIAGMCVISILILGLTIGVLQTPQQLIQNAQAPSGAITTCNDLKGVCKAAGRCDENTEIDKGQFTCTASEPSSCCVPK